MASDLDDDGNDSDQDLVEEEETMGSKQRRRVYTLPGRSQGLSVTSLPPKTRLLVSTVLHDVLGTALFMNAYPSPVGAAQAHRNLLYHKAVQMQYVDHIKCIQEDRPFSGYVSRMVSASTSHKSLFLYH